MLLITLFLVSATQKVLATNKNS